MQNSELKLFKLETIKINLQKKRGKGIYIEETIYNPC